MSYVNLLEIDPDSIFVEYNVKDIQEIDKRIQIEIEKKRQELRCMVGLVIVTKLGVLYIL